MQKYVLYIYKTSHVDISLNKNVTLGGSLMSFGRKYAEIRDIHLQNVTRLVDISLNKNVTLGGTLLTLCVTNVLPINGLKIKYTLSNFIVGVVVKEYSVTSFLNVILFYYI